MTARKKPAINIDEQAFEILSAQIKAQEEENRLAQQTLTNLKLNNRLMTDVIQRYAHLGEDASAFLQEAGSIKADLQIIKAELQSLRELATKLVAGEQALTSILQEMVEELSKRFERFELSVSQRIGRLEDIELFQLTGQEMSKRKAARYVAELSREQKQRELQQHYVNLADLRLQAARHGMNVPVSITNDIRYAEDCIAELEAELNAK